MKKIFYCSLFSAFIVGALHAQNTFPSAGATGIGTTSPNASSLIDITSTTKGVLVPRMTAAQRNAIASPATGLLIYQTNSAPGFYYYSGTAWTAVSSNGPNKKLSNLTGPTALNADLIPNTNNNFNLGSSSFGWKNIYAGSSYYLGGNKVFDITGVNNTFLGANYNSINTGNGNTFTGANAGSNNTTGSHNTTSGAFSLYYNKSGNNNSAYGFAALENNTSGNDNTAIGNYALASDSSGHSNTANGSYSLYSNTEGSYNVSLGDHSLYYNKGGSYNIACGVNSMYNNTEGVSNVAVGNFALYTLSNSIYNCAIGESSMYYNQTGSSNVAVGVYSLQGNTMGYENAASGYYAGSNNTTGHNNTFMGSYSNCSAGNFSNSSAFGNAASITASNQVRIGNSSVTSIGGYANWTNISDGRVKKNIKQDVPGLAFINKLQAVTYNLDLDAADGIVQKPAIKNKEGNAMQPSREQLVERTQKEKVLYTGFVAQDVEKAAKSLNYDFSGVDAPKTDKDLYGLRYSEFVVPLVKAVQELSKANDEKDAKINDLQKQIDELKTMMSSGNKTNAGLITDNKQQTIGLINADLEQNAPNPFTSTTTIHYTLPQTFSSAQIIITDKNGRILKQVNLSGSGKGSLNVEAAMLSAGAYNYSMYVNGRLIGSKQMVLAR